MSSGLTWTVLVVEDEAKSLPSLTACLERDYRVISAPSVAEARRLLAGEEVDLVVCHQQPRSGDSIELLRETRVSHPEAIRILITATTSHEDLIRYINDAAVYQVVAEPWQPDHLLLLVKRALESRELARRHRYLSRELKFADAVLRRQNDHMVRQLQDVQRCIDYARQVNPAIVVMQVSDQTGEGLPFWYDWLRQRASAGTSAPA